MGLWQRCLPFLSSIVKWIFFLFSRAVRLDVFLFLCCETCLFQWTVWCMLSFTNPAFSDHGTGAASLVGRVCLGGDLSRERAWSWVPERPRFKLALSFTSSWFGSQWVHGASASHLHAWDNGIGLEEWLRGWECARMKCTESCLAG